MHSFLFEHIVHISSHNTSHQLSTDNVLSSWQIKILFYNDLKQQQKVFHGRWKPPAPSRPRKYATGAHILRP